MTIEITIVGACSKRKLRTGKEWIKVYISPTFLELMDSTFGIRAKFYLK
jgi:hypothetical protein